MNAPLAPIDLDLLEIDPRSCVLCGLKIGRHDVVDDGDGPLFFCADILPDEMTLDELERRGELIRQEEAAAIFGRLEAMDDPSRRPPPEAARPAYRTPQATIDAFWFVASIDDPARLAAWLADHPRDEKYLQKIWEQKCSTAAAK